MEFGRFNLVDFQYLFLDAKIRLSISILFKNKNITPSRADFLSDFPIIIDNKLFVWSIPRMESNMKYITADILPNYQLRRSG